MVLSMPSKYEEKELTKFLKRELREQLEPKLRKIGFIPPYEEKVLIHKKFDVYAYNKRKRRIAIWELEIKRQYSETNVDKIDKILNFKWKPTIFMFHIFSPIRRSEKTYCLNEARKLKRKYPRKFLYTQLDIKIPRARFRRMLDAFQSNKYYAKQYYGPELKREIKRIVNKTFAKLHF